jgi:hypothetical protein
MQKRYGLGKFIVDVALTFLTGGLFLIWIAIREVRGHGNASRK